MKNLLFSLMFLSCLAHAKPAFQPTHQYPLKGTERWDYLTSDPAAHRLYITRSNRVSVMDTENGQLLGEIQDLQGVHGVALVKNLQLGFITDGKANSVVVFNLLDLKKIASIPVGAGPDSILYEAFSKKIFAFSGQAQELTVINPESRIIEKKLKLKGKPETAVSDEKGSLYLNLEDTNDLVKINAMTAQLEKTYFLKPCTEPAGLAINLKTEHLFVGCGNKMLVIFDPAAEKILGTVKVGEDADALAFEPKDKILLAATGEGPLAIVQLNERDQVVHREFLATKKFSHTLALDRQRGEIYVMEADFRIPVVKSGMKARPAVIEGSAVLSVFKN